MRWNQPGVDYSYSPTSRVLAESSASVFMASVYRWMVAGLAVTGLTAFAVASNPALFGAVAPLMLPLILVELGLVFALSFVAHKVSGVTAALMFLGYAFLNGLTFSAIFYRYSLGSLASAAFITAGAFGALSLYGTVTRKSLSGWSTFLFMGLIGVLLASVVNIFLGSGLLAFVISSASVLVFAGLTAYDTQMLRQLHASSGYASAGALAVSGALRLYLDFINLFISIVGLTDRRR